MRPTLLNFRSPKEKTPEYHTVRMTYKGEALSFNQEQQQVVVVDG
jgi:hypothetical protein